MLPCALRRPSRPSPIAQWPGREASSVSRCISPRLRAPLRSILPSARAVAWLYVCRPWSRRSLLVQRGPKTSSHSLRSLRSRAAPGPQLLPRASLVRLRDRTLPPHVRVPQPHPATLSASRQKCQSCAALHRQSRLRAQEDADPLSRHPLLEPFRRLPNPAGSFRPWTGSSHLSPQFPPSKRPAGIQFCQIGPAPFRSEAHSLGPQGPPRFSERLRSSPRLDEPSPSEDFRARLRAALSFRSPSCWFLLSSFGILHCSIQHHCTFTALPCQALF